MPLVPALVAPPTEMPVSLAQAKAHLRVEHALDDAEITGYVAAAVGHLDGWSGILGRAMVTQSWRQQFDGFDACRLRLRLGPLQSVTSVAYVDASGTPQTLQPAVYDVLTDEIGPYVALAYGQSWPATRPQAAAVTITWVAGYGAAAAVPAPLAHAILLLTGNFYAQRGGPAQLGLSAELARTIDALVTPLRAMRV
jgi:uncharacterized phiE125 gp8 family phage protein